jgi:acetylornithine deacetylase/succinyl-diaminopimelate desuccinylase-like protein
MNPWTSFAEDVWEAEVLATLSRYVTIPCLSPDYDEAWNAHGYLQEAAHLLEDWANKQPIPGMRTEILELPGRTPVLLADCPATRPGASDKVEVLFYGHLDKQPPLGAWRAGLNPFIPVREGDFLYGRGTADDGYALFCALSSLRTLDANGGQRPRCVVMIEASEESGSPDLGAYLEVLADRFGRPGMVVCLDSGAPTYDRLWLTSSLRGIVVVNLRVDVLEHAVHSGRGGGVVPSSFRIMRQLLSRLEDETTGRMLLDELRGEMPVQHREQLEALVAELGDVAAEDLPLVGALELEGTDAVERLARQNWESSLSVTGVGGIPALEDGGNVLRPFTTLKLSIRLPPTADAPRAQRAIAKTLLADPPAGALVTLEEGVAARGWIAPELTAPVQTALAAASQIGFGRAPGASGEGGSIPFLATLAHRFPGVPILATGVLGPGSNAHGPDESLHLPTAKALTATLAHFVANLPTTAE